jgi:YfiH family protein
MTMRQQQTYLLPNWPAATKIRAYFTTRQGGFSQGPYASFNLGDHVGDEVDFVKKNRELLIQDLNLPAAPIWPNQIHGIDVIDADNIDKNTKINMPTADAMFATKPNIVCAILTADCLPIFVCDKNASCVGIIHGGWRSLAAGIIDATVKKLPVEPKDLFIWLGPAIGPEKFEVGEEVRDQFLANSREAERAFKIINTKTNKFLANIYLLATQQLNQLGIHRIFGGEYCTYTDQENFFSYRRDKTTGRMASLIWICE